MIQSVWLNKKWVTLGDSITWQDGHPYPETTKIARGYQTVIREQLGFSEVLNKGISGRPMANGTKNGPGTNATGKTIEYTNFDLVTIAAGTNDFRLDVPIGHEQQGEADTNTFQGAYHDLMQYILDKNPGIRIVLFTPLQRNKAFYDVNYVNQAGYTLKNYVQTIKEIGDQYSVPVCDMYGNSGFTEKTMREFTIDGLHPNARGYERMGNYGAAFLQSIGC
ncbi:SGNH/GDSL hydrolase family protein [Bacillus sp. 1P06AnD]|uniref:SGNH/GDSL hydrolase family protein n=1 Tax=Bacillus sp. 1P06AnD TaxID=3132208 RepID=UPI0039A19086